LPRAPSTIGEQIKKVPPEVRPIVKAARDLVTSVAPKALEVPYDSKPPTSKSFMWKLARYQVGGNNVVGIGTFSKHSALFFYRGRELDDGSGLLQGSGKDSRFISLRSTADAESPAVRRLVQKAFRLAASKP
jgi:hypothetical protein